MPRRIRRVLPDQVFEITSRTAHGRFAFVPQRDLVFEWRGIVAEACQRWPVKVHQVVVLSTHTHMLVTAPDTNVLALWASFVFAATARAAQYHHGLKGRIWARPFTLIPILDMETLRSRVKYLMAQACTEGNDLVESPRHWPGLNSVDALCRGVAMEGLYLTAEERREVAREGVPLHKLVPMNRTLKLAPLLGLPKNRHARQTWYRTIEKEVIEEAKERRQCDGITCAPPESFRRVSPERTAELVSTPAPACHTSCKGVRTAFRMEWAWFVTSWREALEDMKAGIRVCFPRGGWRPFGCTPQLE